MATGPAGGRAPDVPSQSGSAGPLAARGSPFFSDEFVDGRGDSVRGPIPARPSSKSSQDRGGLCTCTYCGAVCVTSEPAALVRRHNTANTDGDDLDYCL